MTSQLKPNAQEVLALALNNLKNVLHLSSEDVGQIIGVHRNTVSRFLKKCSIDPNTKEGELSLLLIRVYRSLFALNGGHLEAMRHWLNTPNQHIQAIPLEAMKTVLGLSRVIQYLDAMRGKV